MYFAFLFLYSIIFKSFICILNINRCLLPIKSEMTFYINYGIMLTNVLY